MTKIVTLYSFRRATGKSTVATNMSVALALQGYRVAVIDADLHAPSLCSFFSLGKAEIGHTFNDYLWGNCTIAQAARAVTARLNIKTGGELFLIPATPEPAQRRRDEPRRFDLGLLNQDLRQLGGALRLDALVIDTSSGLNEASMPLIAVSDLLAILLRYDKQDYQVTRMSLDLAHNLHIEQTALLVNEVLSRSDTSVVRDQIEASFGQPVLAMLQHSDELLALSSADIFMLRYPQHPLATTFQRLAAMIGAPEL